MVYYIYQELCEVNGEKPLTGNILGKKFSLIGIERKRAGCGKREWYYILDSSKIIAKLHESVGEIEEFSDTMQDNSSTITPLIFLYSISQKLYHLR